MDKHLPVYKAKVSDYIERSYSVSMFA